LARRWLAAGAVAVFAATIALTAGCGGGDEEPPDPATLAPPDAPIYIESVAKPEGETAETLEGALSKLLDTDDPAGFVVERLDSELEPEGLSYAEDIDPWLGERGGLFVQTFTDEAEGAAAVDVTDPDAAEAFLDKAEASAEEPTEDATYKGVTYRVQRDGNATGLVGDFLVAGTEGGFKAAVDASQGDSLAENEEFSSESDEFASAFEDTGEEQVMTLYADVPGVLDGVAEAGEITAQERSIFERVLGGAAKAPIVAAIGASEDSVGLDLSAPVSGTAAAPAATTSELLSDLPGESWAAVGFNDLGDALRQGLDELSAAQIPGVPQGGLLEAIRSQTGVDVESYVSWIGDVALFVQGTSPLEVGGGAVIETTDPDASADSLRQLEGLLKRELRGEAAIGPIEGEGEGEGFSVQPPGAPEKINVVQLEDKVAAVYGEEATEQAFTPSQPLRDSEAFENVEGSLGEDLDLTGFVEVEPILDLAEAGGATDDPDYASAQPYLEHLDFLAFGGRQEEERALTRIALGLK
jgi:hypothetical protein